MFALARLLAISFVVLTVVYICLSLYSRATCRSRLAAEWDEAQGPGDRNTYIADGLKEYDGSLRKKLIWGVYVIPTTLMVVIIYLTNFA